MLQIMTPSGWSDFSGIKKTNNRDVIHIDGLTCTPEHLIKNKHNEFIEAQSHKSARKTKYKLDVYDVLGVVLGEEYITNSFISHNCQFRGSSNSLLSGSTLEQLVTQEPINNIENLLIFKEVVEDHAYVCIVDCSEGIGSDYHAVTVIDIAEEPYDVVATYKNNRLSPLLLPNLIFNVASTYNDALVLIESASSGDQVASDLYYDLEYENTLMTIQEKGRQILGFSPTGRLGVKPSKQVKAIGCSTIKTLIEDGKININDKKIIDEFGDFVPKGGSYMAATGANDDQVMTLVLFGWLTTQSYFIDMTDIDVRKRLVSEMMERSSEEMMPFGIIDNGIEEFTGEPINDYGVF